MKNINKINKIDRTIDRQNKLKIILAKKYDKKTQPLFVIGCFLSVISFSLLAFILSNISFIYYVAYFYQGFFNFNFGILSIYSVM